MENDSTKNISYYLAINKLNINHLALLRQWTQLKVAFENETIWLSNFTYEQIESVAVKSLPYKKVFYAQNGKLFLFNHLLPYANEPALSFIPIEEALPLKIESYNHNFFGVDEKVSIELISDDQPKIASAMFLDINALQQLSLIHI